MSRDYVGFTLRDAPSERWLMAPTGTATVIVNLGAPFGGLPGSFVAGLEDTASVVEYGGSWSCLDLKFTPLGAYTLLGLPMEEITGQVVDIADVLGPEGRRMVEAVTAAPTWRYRFALLDDFLLRRAMDGPVPSAEVTQAWRRLTGSGGRVPIGALAAEVGWSNRHLIAKFKEQVGLAPKSLARILRFTHLLDLLGRTEHVQWDRLAVECGYYDQPHLNRDFRDFTGLTPTEYLANVTPGAGVRAPEP